MTALRAAEQAHEAFHGRLAAESRLARLGVAVTYEPLPSSDVARWDDTNGHLQLNERLRLPAQLAVLNDAWALLVFGEHASYARRTRTPLRLVRA